MKKHVDLMLDSGAFSAWKRNEVLDLKKYIKFIENNHEYLFSYVNMDTIPGVGGTMNRSQAEVEDSADKSFKNLKIMQRAGLKPIPVFHQGERWYWLEKMIGEGEPYIGISPYFRANRHSIRDWLDQCFTYLTNEKGQTIAKTHGFGVTSQEFLIRYPWFTADSTSWTMAAVYGQVPVPVYVGGKADYYRKHQQVHISDRARESGSRFFDALSPMAQAMVTKFLEEEVQVTILDVRYDPNLRRRAFLRYFQRLVEHTECPIFKHRRSGIEAKLASKRKVVGPWKLKLIFATGPQHGQYADLMTKVGANNRLISYYDCLQFPPENLPSIVTTGLLPNWKPNDEPRSDPGDWNETYYISRIFRQAYLAGYVPHEHNRFQFTKERLDAKARLARQTDDGSSCVSSE